jgi:hypothetical protein
MDHLQQPRQSTFPELLGFVIGCSVPVARAVYIWIQYFALLEPGSPRCGMGMPGAIFLIAIAPICGAVGAGIGMMIGWLGHKTSIRTLPSGQHAASSSAK